MIGGDLAVFLPVRNEPFLPLPVVPILIAEWERIENPVGGLVAGGCFGKPGDERDACDPDLCGQHTGVAELAVVVLSNVRIGVESSPCMAKALIVRPDSTSVR